MSVLSWSYYNNKGKERLEIYEDQKVEDKVVAGRKEPKPSLTAIQQQFITASVVGSLFLPEIIPAAVET